VGREDRGQAAALERGLDRLGLAGVDDHDRVGARRRDEVGVVVGPLRDRTDDDVARRPAGS
jgi:hypothetical protein